MSVKRYQPVAQCVEPSYQAQMIVPKVMEFSEGEYVLHSDYARLKAEVERLRASSFVTAVPVEKYEKLKAERDAVKRCWDSMKEEWDKLVDENIRLRKAGDITSQRLHWFCQKWGWKDEDLKTLTPEWNASKEGKQP